LVVVVVARVEKVFKHARELILGPQEADVPLLDVALLVVHVEVAAVAVATVLGGLECPLQVVADGLLGVGAARLDRDLAHVGAQLDVIVARAIRKLGKLVWRVCHGRKRLKLGGG
jgi:hypothetical protein